MSHSSSNSNSSSSIDIQELIDRENEFHEAKIALIQSKRDEASSSGGPKKRTYVYRDRVAGNVQLVKDYFADNSTYTATQFRRRFRMRRELFVRIATDVAAYDPRFHPKEDATYQMGFTVLQKCTAAMRFLAYGMAADSIDEYVRIGPKTVFDYVDMFMDAVMAIYGPTYMRTPTDADLHILLQQAESRGFPGMLGSIDCMHWDWKNCPKAWAGQYKSGQRKKPSIILEAVAGPDTWIWHTFFGTAGSNNDLNTLAASPVLDDMLYGRSPKINVQINGRTYNQGYFLADGIYPSYSCFAKTINVPQTEPHREYKKRHESVRKDVERAFGILQARFHILGNPARGWKVENLYKVMHTCIILHNMIVEDERDTYRINTGDLETIRAQYQHPEHYEWPVFERKNLNELGHYDTNHRAVKNRRAHTMLQEDLVQHIWRKFGP